MDSILPKKVEPNPENCTINNNDKSQNEFKLLDFLQNPSLLTSISQPRTTINSQPKITSDLKNLLLKNKIKTPKCLTNTCNKIESKKLKNNKIVFDSN